MDDIMSSWMGLCGEYVCSFRGLSVIGINLLLIVGFVTGLGCKVSRGELLFRLSSPLRIGSLAVNGCLGIVYLGFGLRQLGEKLERYGGFFPLGCWFVLLSQGITLTVIGVMAGIRTKLPVGLFVRIWSGIACALAVLVCGYSARDFFVHKTTSIKLFLDVLTLPGAIMLGLCACRRHSEYEVSKNMDDDSLQMPFNGRSNGDSINYYESVTPFARAGFLSRMTFSWLNSLIKRGYEKPLEEKDIPQLSEADRAEGCYTLFLEQLERQKLTKKTASPSIFWTIVSPPQVCLLEQEPTDIGGVCLTPCMLASLCSSGVPFSQEPLDIVAPQVCLLAKESTDIGGVAKIFATLVLSSVKKQGKSCMKAIHKNNRESWDIQYISTMRTLWSFVALLKFVVFTLLIV